MCVCVLFGLRFGLLCRASVEVKNNGSTIAEFDFGLWEICLDLADDLDYVGDYGDAISDCGCVYWSDAGSDFGGDCPIGLDDDIADGKAKTPPLGIIYTRLLTCLSGKQRAGRDAL